MKEKKQQKIDKIKEDIDVVAESSETEKETVEWEDIGKKPESDELKKIFNTDTNQQGDKKEEKKDDKNNQNSNTNQKSIDDLGLGDLIIDVGNEVLKRKYFAPYNKWSDIEEQRIKKYSDKVEKKYPQLQNLLSNFPEIGLGFVIISGGLERRAKAETVKKEDKK